MNIGQRGIDLIQEYEQCKLVAYKPTPDDVWTCGWGSTKGVTESTVWTQDEADERFLADIEWVERCVNDAVTSQLTQNEFDALCSLCFNIGCKAFTDSTLVRLLNEGALDEAELQFARWSKQKGKTLAGLTRRREAERQLFATT